MDFDTSNCVYVVDEPHDADDFYDSNISSHNSMSTPSERFAWEKHSSGIAMKIMIKMGYKGKGLGKTENGITETIKIKPRKIGVNDTRKKKLTGKTHEALYPIGLHVKPNGREKA